MVAMLCGDGTPDDDGSGAITMVATTAATATATMHTMLADIAGAIGRLSAVPLATTVTIHSRGNSGGDVSGDGSGSGSGGISEEEEEEEEEESVVVCEDVLRDLVLLAHSLVLLVARGPEEALLLFEQHPRMAGAFARSNIDQGASSGDGAVKDISEVASRSMHHLGKILKTWPNTVSYFRISVL
jgi:hypothetical protein